MFTNSQIHIDQLPKVEDIELTPIHRNYLYVLFINAMLLYAGAIGGIITIRALSDDSEFLIISGYLVWLLIILSIISLGLSYLGFKKRKYALREKDITYSHGYIVNKTITLPHNRIQHLEISRPFLSRQFGLSTLKIYSAGESGGDISIKGLPKAVAEQKYSFLTQIINERL